MGVANHHKQKQKTIATMTSPHPITTGRGSETIRSQSVTSDEILRRPSQSEREKQFATIENK